MTDVLGLVLVTIVVAAVLLVTVSALPRVGRLRGLAAMRGPSAGSAAVAGLVCAVAAARALAGFGSHGFLTATSVGSLVGVLFAVLAVVANSTLTRRIVALFGVGGVLAAIGGYLDGGCTVVDWPTRMLCLVVIGAAAAAGIVLSAARGRFHPHAVTALFGAVTVVSFLSSPLGISLVELPVAARVLAIVAALGFGFGAGIAPDVVIGLSALAIGLSVLGAGLIVGTACTAQSSADAVVVFAFGGCFALTTLIARAVVRR